MSKSTPRFGKLPPIISLTKLSAPLCLSSLSGIPVIHDCSFWQYPMAFFTLFHCSLLTGQYKNTCLLLHGFFSCLTHFIIFFRSEFLFGPFLIYGFYFLLNFSFCLCIVFPILLNVFLCFLVTHFSSLKQLFWILSQAHYRSPCPWGWSLAEYCFSSVVSCCLDI